MANHKSAKKRAKRNSKKAANNSAGMTSIKSSLKKVDQAIASGDVKEAEAALKKVQPKLSKGVSKGLLNKNAASRKMSRLSSKVKSLKKKKTSKA